MKQWIMFLLIKSTKLADKDIWVLDIVFLFFSKNFPTIDF